MRGCHDHQLSSAESTLLMLVSAFPAIRKLWLPIGTRLPSAIAFSATGMPCFSRPGDDFRAKSAAEEAAQRSTKGGWRSLY